MIIQSCLRGAIDSVLKLAPKDLPGIKDASDRVIDSAKAVAASWNAGVPLPGEAREELVAAVAHFEDEVANRGGQRIRQVDFLVQQQTRRAMGLAESEAARNSWSYFYSVTSAVVHGSDKGAGPDETRARFNGVLAAFEQLFLGRPERADRLRELALLADPSPAEADEIATWTDPLAGEYFFRAAKSDRWLDVLPTERLLPEPTRWPALPYLQRLLLGDPERVCSWVQAQLPATAERGPEAVSMAVGLISGAGMVACPLVLAIAKAHPDQHVLRRAGYWARDIALSDRTGQWVQVIEAILRAPVHGHGETWDVGQLLRAACETVHPSGLVRPNEDRLGVIIRNALASVLAPLVAGESAHYDVAAVNDLSEVTLDNPPYSFTVTVMRAVLDVAREDARMGIALKDRLKPLESKVAPSPLRNRMVGALLLESSAWDSTDPGRAREWWDTAIGLAGRVVCARSPRADEFDFLALVNGSCPSERQPDLAEAVRDALEAAPSAEEVTSWRADYEANREGLPDAWHGVWALQAVLPAGVVDAWQPVLDVLRDLAGDAVPARPEPLVTEWVEEYGGLPAAVFEVHVAEEGPAAAVELMMGTAVPRQRDDEDWARRGLLADLVAKNPSAWAADPAGVAAVASRALQASYFNALLIALEKKALSADALKPVAAAAFAVRPAAGEASTELLAISICNLLNRSWQSGLQLECGSEAVSWLLDVVMTWTRPRTSEGDALLEAISQPGGAALASLTAWGIQIAHTDSALPPALREVLDRILDAEPDAQALAILGRCLSQLVHADPAWADERSDVLFALDAPWRPARVWLRCGWPHSLLLARLDRAALLEAGAEAEADPVIAKVALALVDGSQALDPVGGLLSTLADQKDGAAAVSRVLSVVGSYAVRCEPASPVLGRAADVWSAALAAGLPAAALCGVGRFAYAEALDDQRWLELTARTVEQQPVLESAYRVAERAAGHPSSPQAVRIAAAILEAPADRFHQLEIRRYAAQVFAESVETDAPERERLRIALINAGAIEDAFGDTGPARKDA
ncbi:hypothetical protein ACH41H_25150 [Streptomyces sp. NPDC020800]|uniref:hypothetical protein n=1 Tax=Streptomyces sp. NPDC020800 TaxID=3365092 RepID=UPI0037A141EE